jgi:hypothetical protein
VNIIISVLSWLAVLIPLFYSLLLWRKAKKNGQLKTGRLLWFAFVSINIALFLPGIVMQGVSEIFTPLGTFWHMTSIICGCNVANYVVKHFWNSWTRPIQAPAPESQN